jgi:hypothetical protein
MRSSRAVALVLGSVLLAGCGQEAALTAGASSRLSSDVARLRTAAVSGTSAQVASAADALRSDVADLRARGDLSAERAAAVLDQLARVLADTAARPAPTPTATPTRAPSPPSGEHHRKKKGGEEH